MVVSRCAAIAKHVGRGGVTARANDRRDAASLQGRAGWGGCTVKAADEIVVFVATIYNKVLHARRGKRKTIPIKNTRKVLTLLACCGNLIRLFLRDSAAQDQIEKH